jgi:hypothetical protein
MLNDIEQEKEIYRRDHKHIAPDLVDGVSDISPASDMYSYRRMFKNIIVYMPLNPCLLCELVVTAIKKCLMYKYSERPDANSFVEIL